MVSQAGAEKKQVAPWMLIVAGIAIIALLTWWGYKNFGPQDPPLSAENVKTQNMIDELAKKSGGDWSKLTPEEQEQLRKAAGPMAPMVLKSNKNAKK